MDPNQRRISSSQCLANPNTVPDTIKTIDKCLTDEENTRITQISNTLLDFRGKVLKYKSIVDDINATGEQLFGQAASPQQLGAIEERRGKLEKERDELKQKIKDYTSIAEVNARDFQDIKAQYPDSFPTSRLNVLEDYSLAIMLSAAVFLVICVFFGYLRVVGVGLLNIGQGLFLSCVILGVILIFMFYFL
jgi:hypothetical protein